MRDRPLGPIRWERHATPRGGERRIARLDPRDEARYRRLVAPLVPTIEASLGSRAFANRVVDGRIGPWARDRRAWRREARCAIAGCDDVVVVVSDVRDCYGAMGERAIGVLPMGTELDVFLHALADTGVRGLPVGPAPSAVLANGILAIPDGEASAAGCRPIRWVDDVVFVAAGRRSAQRAFDAWRRALDPLGLEAHDGKTRWAHGRIGAAALVDGRAASDPGGASRGIIAAP